VIDSPLVWTGSFLLAGVIGLVAVASAAALAVRRPVGWPLIPELGCWLAAGGVAAWAAAGPVRVSEVGTEEPGRLVVLVDGSRSMSVSEGGAPRSDRVEPLLRRLGRLGVPLDIFHYGAELRQGAPGGYDLPETDILAAMSGLRDRVGSERLAAVVVISDGLDRGPLPQRLASGPGERPPGPLTVWQVGGVDALTDVSVQDVDAGGWAFVDTPFTLRARIAAAGAVPGSLPVALLRDGAAVAQATVSFGDDQTGSVSFEVVPHEPGRFHYEVRVEPPLGDAVPANDSMPVVLTVVRDRMRVLQVAGAPGWDVKFLRRLLKGDPGVQLVCFYILRTPADLDSAWNDDELSLIQFPYQDLFDAELDSFDLVVLQDFDYEPYFEGDADLLLTNLADWVRDGGGLVFVGGERALTATGLATSPLADVLPFQVGPPSMVPTLGTFRPSLTEEGSRHPLTRLVGDAGENASWWARLPEFHGVNTVRGRVADAAVLLEHPGLRLPDGTPHPVLAVREVERGRSLALLGDESWRWSVTEAAAGRGNQAYLRFWKNAMRWLLRDPALSRVTVDTPRENYRVGEEVRVVARVRDPGFLPQVGAHVRVLAQGPGEPFAAEGVTGPDGEVVFPWLPPRAGTWRLHLDAAARPDPGGSEPEIGTADSLIAVTERDPELDQLRADDRMMRWAQALGGTWALAADAGSPELDPGAGRVRLTRTETRLDRGPAVAWSFAGLVAAAVVLRRLTGGH
jgi:uncharacterized membrane protein